MSNSALKTESPAKLLVIHGFTCHRVWLTPLCYLFHRQGYRVDNFGYPSFFRSIESHATALHAHLTSKLVAEERVDIFAHSMGSLITRKALDKGGVNNIGRIVLLTPPSHGTPVARWVAPVIGKICRCVPEMSDGQESLANQLPPKPSTDVGVIAAKFDTLVPNRCTHVDGEQDHVTLWHSHNSVLFSPKVSQLADHFFRHGKF